MIRLTESLRKSILTRGSLPSCLADLKEGLDLSCPWAALIFQGHWETTLISFIPSGLPRADFSTYSLSSKLRKATRKFWFIDRVEPGLRRLGRGCVGSPERYGVGFFNGDATELHNTPSLCGMIHFLAEVLSI